MVWQRATAASIRHGMNGVWRTAGLVELTSFSWPLTGLVLAFSWSEVYLVIAMIQVLCFVHFPFPLLSVYRYTEVGLWNDTSYLSFWSL